MADEPISALTLFTSYSTADEVEILDVSDTTFASTGTNKRIPFSTLLTMAGVATAAGVTTVAGGGTGLTAVGSADQLLGVAHTGGALEYKTLTAGPNVTITPAAGSITIPASGGGGGSPGGSSGQIQTNNGSGGFRALAVPLPVASGGTGLGTLTAHGVMLGEGTGAPGFATVGTAGRVLTDQGSGADPVFAALPNQLTVGNGISGGLNNAVLYENGSGKLAASANLTFNGTNSLLVSQAGSSPSSPANIGFGATAPEMCVSSSSTLQLLAEHDLPPRFL